MTFSSRLDGRVFVSRLGKNMEDFCILMHASSWKVRCDMLAAAPPVPGATVPKQVLLLQRQWRRAIRRHREHRLRRRNACKSFDRLFWGMSTLVLTEDVCRVLLCAHVLQKEAMATRIQRAFRRYAASLHPRSFYIRRLLYLKDALKRRRRTGKKGSDCARDDLAPK